MDWRPREFNAATDLMAGHVLDKKNDVQHLDMLSGDSSVGNYAVFQNFSDGASTANVLGAWLSSWLATYISLEDGRDKFWDIEVCWSMERALRFNAKSERLIWQQRQS